MRAWLMMLLLAACTDTRPCRQNTVHVIVTLDAEAAKADALRVEVTLDGNTITDEIPHRPGVTSGGLAIEFASGYPAGKEITLALVALQSQKEIARSSVPLTLAPGCTLTHLELGVPRNIPDLAAPDLTAGGADLANDDLAGGEDLAKLPGDACSSSGQCASGFCVDGYCCDTACDGTCEACDVTPGTCAPVVAGQPHGARPACTNAGTTCGGICSALSRTACSYPGVSTSCRAQSCSGNTKTFAAGCDGAGACPAPSTTTCSASCSGNDCLGACQSDGQCSDAAKPYCNQGTCLATRPNGRACGNLSQCTSGNCIDGYCCESPCSGQCQACDVAGNEGQCRTLISGAPHGVRAACAGSGLCQGSCTGSSPTACGFPSSSVLCSAQSCNAGVQSNAAFCNGAGSCQTPTTQSCTPFACNGTTACFSSCSSDSHCGAANPYCNGGTCKTTLPNGRGCSSGSQCTSGNCVDGTCCGSGSCSTCFACNVAGHEGACFAAPAGTPCGGFQCDNTASGSGRQACNGAGSCGTPTSFPSCAPYKCNTATGTCFTNCGGCDEGAPDACGTSASKFCASGHVCGGLCCPEAGCDCQPWICG